jgi:two-component system chemotaxis sensor kinase CheA
VARDPYEYFRVEAREILDGLGRGVLQLEKGATPELVAGLLRLAHTLKGAARVVKQRTIGEQAHALEERLSLLREARSPVAREPIDQVLALLDAMAGSLAAIDAPAAAPGVGEKPRPVEEAPRMVRADVGEGDALVDAVAEAGQQLRTMRGALGRLPRARQLAEQLGSGDGAASARRRAAADELQSLVARLERELTGALDQTEREMREVRDAVEKLRLAPASTLFVSLERTARDVAQSLGRQTSFEAKGGEVRIDAHVLAIVQGALVQLVRNAVAHGIEPAAERTQNGKSAIGRVEIEVLRHGNRVAFLCRDDGRGVDLEAVRRVAQRSGILPPGGSQADAGALLKLLLKGGLTTSAAVTELSGRGIGLDVAREAAAQLGGEVTVDTVAGRGTAFQLTVPLSLSSLDALVVEAGGVAAVIPFDAVRRTVRLTKADIARTAEGETVVHEGRVIPFVPLARYLGGAEGAAPSGKGGARSAVVVGGGAALAAVGVDRLIGTANVVLRPLPSLAPADPIVLGATIDAEGTPQLVLDPEALVAAASRADQTFVPAHEVRAATSVLIIDDSLTTRMLERSILESAGYQVELATSAEEGLEKARQRRYQLFLVDVEMPGMDGFTFVATTRADALLREVPAILVTSRNAPEDRQRGTDAGASGYVVKGDFDQGQLLALIRKLVG